MKKFSYILKVSLFFLSISTFADNSAYYQQTHIEQCGEHYFQQTVPKQTNDKNFDIYYLCFQGFAVGYSGVSKTALWSAEHLTKQRIEQAQLLERTDNFHEESQLPDSVKAFLTDYKKAPYDRGHLAPNADMATVEQQYDSFSLANIVPQNPLQNRQVWRKLETNTRYLAIQYGEVYVITGTAFSTNPVKLLKNRVFIPSHLFKIIYIPSINQAIVYYAPNDDSQFVETISLAELNQRIHFDVMPTLPDDVKNQIVATPFDHQNHMVIIANENKNYGFFAMLGQVWQGIIMWFVTTMAS